VIKLSRIALVLFLICLTAALPAWGNKEKNNVVKITGIVRLVGSGTFRELIISGQDKEWYIEKNDEQKLWDLQQKKVTVEGIETVKEIKFKNSQITGERRTLKDIKIISVE